MLLVAYNPTDQPVVIDAAGRTLGGREWGVVDTTADETQAAEGSDRLYFYRDLEAADDMGPGPKEALKLKAEIESRAATFGRWDRDELARKWLAHTVTENLDDIEASLADVFLHKPALVYELARRTLIDTTKPYAPPKDGDTEAEPVGASPASGSRKPSKPTEEV